MRYRSDVFWVHPIENAGEEQWMYASEDIEQVAALLASIVNRFLEPHKAQALDVVLHARGCVQEVRY